MSDVTRILSQIESGDPTAAEKLLPLVYDELRKLAMGKLAHEKPGQTLQATALVHEAYLRMVAGDQPRNWNGRGHFFGAAAEAMRRILVEYARKKRGPKSGGDRIRVALDAASDVIVFKPEEVIAVHEALADLAQELPAAAELVKLRYFAGMSQQEAADCLGISRSTADRQWAFAKAVLFCSLQEQFRRD